MEEDYDELAEYELLRKYYFKKKLFNGVHKADVLYILITLAIYLAVIIWCAVPYVSFGGVATSGKTLNLFALVYLDENSLFNQIVSFVDNITVNAEEVLNIMSLLRNVILIEAAAVEFIVLSVYMIRALVGFFGHKTQNVAHCATGIAANATVFYMMFAYFGSVSGGSGEFAYYVGYKADGKAIMVIVVCVLIMLATAIIKAINSDELVLRGENLYRWAIALVGFLGSFALCCVCAGMNMYAVFSYILSSALTGALYSIMYSFNISTMVFPVFNLFLLCVAMSLYLRAKNRARIYLYYLLTADMTEDYKYALLKSKRIRLLFKKRVHIAFVYDFIVALLSVFVIEILTYSSIGFGWSVNILSPFILAAVFAAICMCVMFIIRIVLKPRKQAILQGELS